MYNRHAWLRGHPMLVDCVLAVVLALLSVGTWVKAPTTAVAVWAAVASLLLAATVVPRRRYPVAAFAVAMAFGIVQIMELRPAGANPAPMALQPSPTDLTIVVLLYTLAAYRPRRISVAGLGVCLAAVVAAVARWAPAGPAHSAISLLVAGGGIGLALSAWVLGDSMAYRRAYNLALEGRAARAEAERDAQAQIAAAAERARIARELHDVIAHHVSVMVVQADGGSYALDAEPERARQALAAISRTGRQALGEMRRLLGVLRPAEDDQAELAPQPRLAQMDELLEQARAAGVPVSFTVEGVPRPLPDGPALAAYRLVQESLTNVRKHGGAAVMAAVTLRFTDDGLVIRVSDDGRGGAAESDGAGHGLAGMRERMELYGGTVDCGPRPGGGYLVTGKLPFTPPAKTRSPDPASRGAA
jgi:signal transduction histidine kinase